jgi:hypothetical protein
VSIQLGLPIPRSLHRIRARFEPYKLRLPIPFNVTFRTVLSFSELGQLSLMPIPSVREQIVEQLTLSLNGLVHLVLDLGSGSHDVWKLSSAF